MNGGNKVFAAAALGVALLVFGASAYFVRTSQPEPEAGPAAPAELLIRAHSPVTGPAEAPVTVVEFLDPECESCRAMHPIVKDLMQEYDGRVRLVTRYLALHSNSALAASLLEEARELGKHDEALDVFFTNQPDWGNHSDPKPQLLPVYLEQIGIPASSWDLAAVTAEHRDKLALDEADARRLGVRGTPTFFVNGVLLPELGREPLERAIERALDGAAG